MKVSALLSEGVDAGRRDPGVGNNSHCPSQPQVPNIGEQLSALVERSIPRWIFALPPEAPVWMQKIRAALCKMELPVGCVGQSNDYYIGAYLGTACAQAGWPSGKGHLAENQRMRIPIAMACIAQLNHACYLPPANAKEMVHAFALAFETVIDYPATINDHKQTTDARPVYQALWDCREEIERQCATKELRRVPQLAELVCIKMPMHDRDKLLAGKRGKNDDWGKFIRRIEKIAQRIDLKLADSRPRYSSNSDTAN